MNACKPQLCYGLSVLGALVRGSGDGRERKTTGQTDEPDRSSVCVFHQFISLVWVFHQCTNLQIELVHSRIDGTQVFALGLFVLCLSTDTGQTETETRRHPDTQK
jgi:hypothetical protein